MTRDAGAREGSVAFQTKGSGVFIVLNNLLTEHFIRALTGARCIACATFPAAGFLIFISKTDRKKESIHLS